MSWTLGCPYVLDEQLIYLQLLRVDSGSHSQRGIFSTQTTTVEDVGLGFVADGYGTPSGTPLSVVVRTLSSFLRPLTKET